MTPKQYYQQKILSKRFVLDPIQEKAIQHLERVYHDLILAHKKRNNPIGRLHKLVSGAKKKPVKGLYLWGGVGIGKTYLMDLFFDSLPFERKLRLHFHRFMQQVHQDLKRLQGEKDPLAIVAREFSLHTDVICFDEFFVNDITDAMLLAGLFDALFARGVCLVATSNVEPDDLYKNGLQRTRFLPAIELIKQHTEVLHVQSDIDYRLRNLQRGGVYFTPLDAQAQLAMQDCFAQCADIAANENALLNIQGRDIRTIAAGNDVVWFDFKDICSVPRSQQDYLEIAQLYTTVLVSNVPQIKPEQTDVAIYLINLVDVLYDARVNLILSAAVPIEELYTSGAKAFEFERTKSRLHEMQSWEYLHQAHLG